jgi:hypothetical protein
MKRMRKWLPALLAACALASGCTSGDTASTVPTQPSSFAPPTMTETFTGTLTLFGTDSHPFDVPVPGEVDITLKSTDPVVTTPITLSIGLPSSTVVGQCATISSVSATASNVPQITGHALAGKFCVSLSDGGTLSDSVTYTVIVAHP